MNGCSDLNETHGHARIIRPMRIIEDRLTRVLGANREVLANDADQLVCLGAWVCLGVAT